MPPLSRQSGPTGRFLGWVLPQMSPTGNENASVVRWLIQLRWVATVVLATTGYLGFLAVFLEPLLLAPYLGAVFFLFLFNCFSVVWLRANPQPKSQSLLVQLMVDASVLTFLLALTGGTRNPFVPVLFINATLGALLLKANYRRGFLAYLLICLIALFKTRNWQVMSSDLYVWEVLPVFVLAISVAITMLLVASLSDTLRKARETLAASQYRQERIHHLLALGAMTAEFAHEFATPLNNLRLRLGRLKRQLPPGVAEQDFTALTDSLNQSEKLLREMTASPLDSAMLTFEPVEIGLLAEEAVSEWKQLNPSCDVQISNQLVSGRIFKLPRKIFAKSLLNLLDNAAAAETELKAIELHLHEDQGFVFISVLDRGPGWPKLLKEQGAQPHFTTRPGGTGLGLFNCQSLCEVLGGSLELLDREGGGAIAKLALPKSA